MWVRPNVCANWILSYDSPVSDLPGFRAGRFAVQGVCISCCPDRKKCRPDYSVLAGISGRSVDPAGCLDLGDLVVKPLVVLAGADLEAGLLLLVSGVDHEADREDC